MKLIATLLLLTVGCASYAAYWGVAGDFADLDPDVSARLAPVYARQGVNSVLLNMRGSERGWFLWTRTQRAWEDAKFSVFWDAPSSLGECDRIRGFGEEALPVSGQPLDRGSSFLSKRWAAEVKQTTAQMAFRLRSTSGYRVTAPVDLSGLAADADTAASWRKFAAEFFDDKSPARDTNADTASFNSAFRTSYESWDQVALFRESELSDIHKSSLRRLWLAKAHADYVNDTCGTLGPLTRDRLSGPAVAALSSTASDASMLASSKFVRYLYATDEAAIPALDCAAAVFGKRVLAAPVTLAAGDHADSRTKILKMLPYIDGAFFDRAAAGFDAAPQVILELAPFVGRLQANRAGVLWVVPADASAPDILDAYCVTEDAFALDPDSIEVKKYQAVIYLNSTPCISTSTLQRLFDYAVNGGVVFLDAYHIGKGVTLHGRDNGHYWWQDLSLAREKQGVGTTSIALGESLSAFSLSVEGTYPYMTAEPGKFSEFGRVTDSTGAAYPLLYVRRIGSSGKWVFINLPDPGKRFPLLRAIVKDQVGIELPDRSRARVYTGPGCALALGGREAENVSIPCGYAEAVVFDPHTLAVLNPRPVSGLLAMPDKLRPGEVKLWVSKPYGKPVLLYADGASGWAASIEDGVYDGKTLKFTFAERAFVSSPSRPKVVAIAGSEVGFDYDETLHLLKITRASVNSQVEAEVTWQQPGLPQ